MTCIHGLDEINCPNCRIMKASFPLNDLKIKELYNNDFTIKNPYFNKKFDKKDDFSQYLIPKKLGFKLNSFFPISTPRVLNDLPDFRSKMFREKLSELEITKADTFQLSKKTSLESPEWKFRKEE
ncbi:MAG: hypothetical protein ACTSRI_16460 [Promethearchaeota archaeon]